jgi:DNA topoisomerase II
MYMQVFSENMGKKSEPQITKCKQGENWTRVTFKPDLFKFNMTHLEDDVVALMRKRVVDMAGTLGKTVKVELDGQRLPIKSFLEYVKLYFQDKPDDFPRFCYCFIQTSVRAVSIKKAYSVPDRSHLTFFSGFMRR